MVKDEYLHFTEMLTKANIPRTTLYRLIKDGKIRFNVSGSINLYSYKDVINNKPRKK